MKIFFYSLALAFGLGYGIKHLRTTGATILIALPAAGAYLVSGLFGNTMFYTYPCFMIILAMAFSKADFSDSREVHHEAD